MKTKLFFAAMFLILSNMAFAQQGINYKAIVKDGNGNVVASQTIDVRFTIIADTGPTNVYLETHTGATTDANGIVILNIGDGTSGDVFTDINWGSDIHALKVEIDIEQDASFVDLGTTQFKSVPFALYGKTAKSLLDYSNFEAGDILKFNGTGVEPATYSFYYQDNDSDGFGSNNKFIYSPIKPDGFVEVPGDSNDDDPNINPDITEVCGDGIDNNSNGQIDEGC